MKAIMPLLLAFSVPTLALAGQAQQAPVAEEQWQELPRNTTIYVPVPKQVTPVAAYRSCSNRYEGEQCDFTTPRQGVIEGTCQAPELRQPPAYGYEVQQYPAQVRTALVCMPVEGPGGDGRDNPGHETALPPPAAAPSTSGPEG
ncbi:hypothetical protein K4A76_20275 [Pseudomonas sp. NEEL19]|uniref:hypothetical protein n=1 Tax=Pseudomonas sp. NEEL19 TaxID=2867409 RepID=UPI002368CC18|nr:hypothetical protein [Pseudomonas sp. NEEL19]WDM58750.1 hypothetical protein K4A76_20275 [Pseudomonas sp. NEEL19]